MVCRLLHRQPTKSMLLVTVCTDTAQITEYFGFIIGHFCDPDRAIGRVCVCVCASGQGQG